jgi:hypothetical protein
MKATFDILEIMEFFSHSKVMFSKRALRYSVLGLAAIFVFVVVLGFISWQTNSGYNGSNVHHCSILLQYCGLDARISIKEMLYLWGAWGLLPTLALLRLFYRQAESKPPKFWRFLLELVASIVLQSVIAFQLWGVKYFVNDFVRSSAALGEIPFLNFFFGFVTISLLTVGVIAVVFALVSSRIVKTGAAVK